MLLIKRENNRSIPRFFVFIAILLFIFLICVSSANATNIKIDSVNLIEENTTIYLFDDHIEGVSNFTLINKENKTVNKSFFYRPGYFIVEGKVICNSKEVKLRGKGSALSFDMFFEHNEEKILIIYFNAYHSIAAYNLKSQGGDTEYYLSYVVPGLIPRQGQTWSQPVEKIKIRVVAISKKYVFPEFIKTYDPFLHFPVVYWEEEHPVFEYNWNNLKLPEPASKQRYEHRKDAVWSYTPYYPIIEIKGTDFMPIFSLEHILLVFGLVVLLIFDKMGNVSLGCSLEGFDIKEFEKSKFRKKTLIVMVILMPIISILLSLIILPLLIEPIGRMLDRSWSISSLQVIWAVITAEGASGIHFFSLVIPYLGIRVVIFFLILVGGFGAGIAGLVILLFKTGFIISAIKTNKTILLNYPLILANLMRKTRLSIYRKLGYFYLYIYKMIKRIGR